MEEKMKKNVMVLLCITNAVFLFLFFGSCSKERKQTIAWRSEMANRLDSEEKMNEAIKEKDVLKDKLAQMEKDLTEQKTALEQAQKALSQERLVNKNLGLELEKVNRLKDAVEDELKKNYTVDKPEKSKRKD